MFQAKSTQWQTPTFDVSTPTWLMSSPSQVDTPAHTQAAIVLDHRLHNITGNATYIHWAIASGLFNEILSPSLRLQIFMWPRSSHELQWLDGSSSISLAQSHYRKSGDHDQPHAMRQVEVLLRVFSRLRGFSRQMPHRARAFLRLELSI